jgi:hypothetical protein
MLLLRIKYNISGKEEPVRRFFSCLKITAFILLAVLMISPVSAAKSEISYYQEIIRKDRSAEEHPSDKISADIAEQCGQYLKKFKTSPHSNEIRIIAVKHEELPVASLAYCISLVKSGISNPEKIKAYLWMCNVYYLSSRFEDCADASLKALSLSPKGDDKKIFALLRIRSLILLQEYEKAAVLIKAHKKILENEADNLSSEIVMRTGEGHDPLNGKKEMPPTRLYMLAHKFELEHNNDFAFSAYKDLKNKYPRSPEAMVSASVFASLEKSGAKYSSSYNRKSSSLHLTPDYAVDTVEQSKIYAVLIGPIYDLNEAKGIKKEMTPDFAGILLVRGKDGFYLYVGNEPSAEKALALKIRIAEEYALNGKIALRKEESGREYIYGE